MENTERINSKAIISLVLGAVTLVLPLLGIITGIIGIIYYTKAKKEMVVTGETGEGVSIGGLVLNIVGLVLQLLGLIFIFFIIGTIVMDAAIH